MKKIVFIILVIVAVLIGIYKWIMSDDIENNEEKQETTTEEVKEEPANNETINVKPETNAEEVKNGNDTVNENHK